MDTFLGLGLGCAMLVIAVGAGCEGPGATSGADQTVTDAIADAIVPDTVGEVGIADTGTSVSDGAGDDAQGDDTVVPGADTAGGASHDNPDVGCRVDSECGAGNVCCTLPSSYFSACVADADCSAGLKDACLTDEQCSARRPGQWSVCCHDRGNRNYCAPIRETCQALVACQTPADCAGNGSEVCCSPHPYYRAYFCTSEFFAVPARDCP